MNDPFPLPALKEPVTAHIEAYVDTPNIIDSDGPAYATVVLDSALLARITRACEAAKSVDALAILLPGPLAQWDGGTSYGGDRLRITTDGDFQLKTFDRDGVEYATRPLHIQSLLSLLSELPPGAPPLLLGSEGLTEYLAERLDLEDWVEVLTESLPYEARHRTFDEDDGLLREQGACS